jgi:DmsE family decaheme c-type cytochrome
MGRAHLNYKGNLHADAEANGTSCAGCHAPGGKAFASQENCQLCHLEMGEPPQVAESTESVESALPSEFVFDTKLGKVSFDHYIHIAMVGEDCTSCHNKLFPMTRDPLGYSGDLHRTAETNQSACAGCHYPGGIAFASADNCERCHADLGPRPPTAASLERDGGFLGDVINAALAAEPIRNLAGEDDGEPASPPGENPEPAPQTARVLKAEEGVPVEIAFESPMGEVKFSHSDHVAMAGDDCLTCHNKIFPLKLAPLNYGADMHQTAEAGKTSCAVCHVDDGLAFASGGNCQRCHEGAGGEEGAGADDGLPKQLTFETGMGNVTFSHEDHVLMAGEDCTACHTNLFPMERAPLNYGDNLHQTAEANKTSCAGCHVADGVAFATAENCQRCHQSEAQPEVSEFPDGYAGSESCGMCHQDIFQNFQVRPHRLLTTSARWDVQETSCESCHGPGREHSETTDTAKTFGFNTGEHDRNNQACLKCHDGQETHRGRLFSSHVRNSVDCVGCHNIHTTPEDNLLADESNALCSSCHLSAKAAFARPFRHKLNEGAIDCVDCHNPHGGPPPAQMRRVSANEPVCLKCHADKRGPFPFEHAPVKMEPCSTCHEPHGSANPRMLTRHNIGQSCLECHAGSMSTLGGIPPAFHDLRSARFQNCTICHSKIHGSFVSRDFLR